MSREHTYQEIKASEPLSHMVHSFWKHANLSMQPESMTIFPDSFFKLIFMVKEGRIVKYFMTGLWTEQKEFMVPAGTITFGCRLKILAPEYLINEEIAPYLNSIKKIDLSYLNIEKFNLDSFEELVQQWENELKEIVSPKAIPNYKSKLSELLYQTNGELTAKEVSERVYWTNRQINRYLNKYLGLSLKKYLNIQKCYTSYLHIRKGKLAPDDGYFDQAHFIKEVKKHTGETPRTLYKEQNDRFIQLKNIQEK